MIFLCFIFLYSIMMYGLSNILVHGSGPFNIIYNFRIFMLKHVSVIGEMLRCMMCTSLNLGLLFSLFNVFFFPEKRLTPFNFIIDNTHYWYLTILLDAFFTSGIVWISHSFQEMCENISNYFSNEGIEDE